MTMVLTLFPPTEPLSAVWSALREVMPAGVALRGCHFHHRQSIMRRVKKIPGISLYEAH